MAPAPLDLRSERRKQRDALASSLRTRLAFYTWLTLLLISLTTFALGISGHIITLLAAPWLSIKTEAAIQASIPVFLTAVKIVTVPLILVLTPFARHHRTFRSWTRWSTAMFQHLEEAVKIPLHRAKAGFVSAKSFWLRLTRSRQQL
jgi:hypothetical protein